MKKGRLNIALLIPHYQNMFSTFYTLEIIKEISEAAIKNDIDLLIETRWRIEGASGILFADIMGNEDNLKKARKERIPYLILNYYNEKSEDNCIGIDNEKASFEAVEYLIDAGHRRIATITGKLNAQAGISRLEGFKKALRTNKIDLNREYIVNGDWSKESGKIAMKKLLALKHIPTAVFVAGDEMALGAIEEAKRVGLKIPDDISFIGFDNIPEACSPVISLTTIEQPFSDLASLGVKKIIEIIEKRPKTLVKILLDNTKLIERKSVKKIKDEV